MKHAFTSLLTLVAISTTILSGCAKEKPDEPTIRLSFTKKALEYVQLVPGKYLLYKDSATAQVDSVVVTESRIDEFYSEEQPITWDYSTWFQEPTHYGENFYLTLTKYDGAVPSTWLTAMATTNFVYLKPMISSDTSEMSLYANATFDTAAVFIFQNYMNPNYSMTVEGQVYNNVAVTSYASEFYLPGDPYYKSATYYWAEGVGMIKMRIIRGTDVKTYLLFRHN